MPARGAAATQISQRPRTRRLCNQRADDSPATSRRGHRRISDGERTNRSPNVARQQTRRRAIRQQPMELRIRVAPDSYPALEFR